MTAAGDDWLEGVLRADAAEHAASYLADEGFTARELNLIRVVLTRHARKAREAWDEHCSQN